MKKQNEAVNIEAKVVKAKKTKRERIFFLYSSGKGFICEGNDGVPVAGWKKPLTYSTRAKAKFAADFFKSMKLAEDIAIFMNIA